MKHEFDDEQMASKFDTNVSNVKIITLQSRGEIVLCHFAKRIWEKIWGLKKCVSQKIHQGFRKPCETFVLQMFIMT
jgi:hypothetical protein